MCIPVKPYSLSHDLHDIVLKTAAVSTAGKRNLLPAVQSIHSRAAMKFALRPRANVVVAADERRLLQDEVLKGLP